MATNDEGPVFRQLPLLRGFEREAVARSARRTRDGGDPRCEMCGSPVIASHCKRICLKCGFMTGCSEGI